jgi:biopolymer transport protein TolR
MGISTDRAGRGPRSNINITPLVDVALVLLILFLVAMPILVHHMPLEVPPEAPPGSVSTTSPIVLVGQADGTVELDDGTGAARTVSRTDLARTIRPMLDAIQTERVVFVDFDRELEYQEVISIIDTVKGIGRDATGNEVRPVRIAVKASSRRPSADPTGE